MIDTTPPAPRGRQVVQAYRTGAFTVSGVTYHGSVLVLPDQALAWAAESMDDVTAESLLPLRSSEIDLLLIGTGHGFALVPTRLQAELRSWGIVVEGMGTPAACRTYNVLAGEGRRVAAALLVVST